MMASISRPVSRSAPVCPNGTAKRAIGMERNRSITPREASAAIRVMTPSHAEKVTIANRPGMRYSR
jgi:hypothetical protein